MNGDGLAHLFNKEVEGMSVNTVITVIEILIRPGNYVLGGGEEESMSFSVWRGQVITPVVGGGLSLTSFVKT